MSNVQGEKLLVGKSSGELITAQNDYKSSKFSKRIIIIMSERNNNTRRLAFN